MKTNYNLDDGRDVWFKFLLVVTLFLGTIGANAQTYCAASAMNSAPITNVTFNTINHSSSGDGYQDFRAVSTTLERNSATPFTATTVYIGNSGYVKVWIDFNHDGDFVDADETVLTSSVGQSPYTGTILIPSTAQLGNTVMRVRFDDSSWMANNTSCGDGYYGQVEDYTVNILPVPFYCTAGSTDTTLEKISKVVFNNINNTSTSTSGYEDFSNITGNTAPGATYLFTANTTQGYFTDQLLVWIDYNMNGSFSDPGENVYTSPISAGPYSTNITIPTNSPNGLVRMRVRLTNTMNSGVNATPCGTSFFGQVEDYTLNVNCIPVSWYVDADNDGFGDPATEIVQCETFGGYVLNGDDCNDSSATYADADGDGFGVGPAIPCGTATNNFDCNDSLIYYWDADQDGYGAGNPVSCGYVNTNTDCNDSEFTINPGRTENLTNGIDDNCNGLTDENVFAPYCAGSSPSVLAVTLVNFAGINNVSAANSSSIHENFISLTGNVTQGQSYSMTLKAKTFGGDAIYFVVWIDWDKNGIFNTTNEKYLAGSVVNSTGTDGVEAVSSIVVPVEALTGSTRMRIQANELFSASNPCSIITSGQFEDYTINVTACTGSQWYADTDNDGFGDPAVAQTSCVQPTGYVSNNSDCNDASSTYADLDGDGYGAGVAVACGVTNNSDCDDSNASVYQSNTLFVDADNDGYTSGNAETVCYGATIPSGYTLSNSNDCNDSSAAINPGQPEIPANGADDNCNGQTDEGVHFSIPYSGNNSIACGSNTTVYDHGGEDNYSDYANGYTVLQNAATGVINISGTYDVEGGWDYIYIYDGAGTGGTLLQTYTGSGTINYTGSPGQILTIHFTADEIFAYSGFVLNITYTGSCAATVCSGTPAPGNTISSASTACAGSTVNLSLQNANSGDGLSYQWQQSSTQAGTYSDISGATGITYTPIINEATWFRANVTCSGVTTASTPVGIALTPQSNCYCISTIAYPCDYDMVIYRVILNTLDNNTGGACTSPNGVADYTSNPALTTTLQPGLMYNMTTYLGINSQGVAAWIDLNNDGEFSDTTERITNSNEIFQAYGATNIQVNIPCDAPSGQHTLRIRTSYNTGGQSITPCGFALYGEVEDYVITIAVPGACGAPGQLSAANITTTTASLSWGNLCGGNAWEVLIQPVGTGTPTGSGIAIGSMTYNATGLATGSNYEFYVRTVCSPGSYSTWSNPHTFQTSPVVQPFGIGVWNVNCYNGSQLDTYAGYYVDPALDFNTSSQWSMSTSPSNAPGYIGAAINYDSHSYSAKRKGFTPDCYSIYLVNHDDDTALYIDGVQVFQHTGGGDGHNIIWLGQLDANSEIEIVTKEFTGSSNSYYWFNSTSQQYYVDADGDGFGNYLQPYIEACSLPAGYADNSDDCDDANAAINPDQTEILSNGIDENCNGIFDDTPSAAYPYCDSITYTSTVEPITLVNFAGINNTSSATVMSVSGGGIPMENFIAVTGNVTAGESYTMTLKGNTDGGYTNNFTVWIDWDQDTFFNTTTEKYLAGSINGSDGNDAISAISTIAVPTDALPGTTRMRVQKLYNSFPANPCVGGNYGQTEDYSLVVTGDCTPVMWYEDADGDGFGISTTMQNTCTQPVGYVSNNTDCNDGNAAVNAPFEFYTDADGDGYGSGTTATLQCAANAATAPVGYSVNNTDCNDAIAAINPGHGEVLYNGVDDNCNNQLDEGFQMKTKLLASICGTTLAAIGSLIGITTVSSTITGYRIKVTNGATVQIIERSVPHFTLPNLASYDYATTYSVEIELQRNGIWLGYYGDACLVTSPAILAANGATQVAPSQCGITLPKINTLIATTSLAGVTGYRFKVTNITPGASGPNVIQTIDRTLHWFNLPMLVQYNYGSTYRIEIAVKTTGAFSGYGSPCEVSSPPAPSLINCGGVVTSSSTLIASTSMQNVTQYRFQITRMSDNATTTIDRNNNYFTFAMVPGYTPASQYAVRVAVMTAGSWSPFGDACEITSPGSASRFIEEAPLEMQASEFKAIAYPNPFASTFAIDVTTSSADNMQINVYDMTGRLIESRYVKSTEINALQVGDRLPTGVFNVIVTQGANVETLRVIKR